MPYSSRIDDAYDEIVAEVDAIATTSGYYTTPTVVRAIRPADAVVNSPEIGIEFGQETMASMDDNADVFWSEVRVYMVGTTVANAPLDADASELVDATEQLRHDMKRCVARFYYKYWPNSTTPKWSVLGSVLVIPVLGLGERQNKAQVWMQFTIKVWSMPTTLT